VVIFALMCAMAGIVVHAGKWCQSIADVVGRRQIPSVIKVENNSHSACVSVGRLSTVADTCVMSIVARANVVPLNDKQAAGSSVH
jgi:hypothetical protein